MCRVRSLGARSRRWLLAVGLVALATGPAHAAIEVAVGLADEIDGKTARSYAIAWLHGERHPWELAAGFFSARRLDPTPLSLDRGYLALGRRYHAGRVYAVSGVAWVTYDDEVLSGRFQFQTGIGVDVEDWSMSLRHLSNAGTRGRNRGETFLLLARRW